MNQLKLPFKSPTRIHRERDRPKAVSMRGWSRFLDDVCLRRGIEMTHERLITLLHCAGMEFRHIGSLSEFNSVHLTRIESWLDRQMWVCNAEEIVGEVPS